MKGVAFFVLALCCCALTSFVSADTQTYLIGVGMTDITGPVAQANMMGMAQLTQIAKGLQLRLRARAFVFADSADEHRVAFVHCDLGMIFGSITTHVVQLLQQHFKDNRYGFGNVMLSASHTHSGPAGFSTEPLYDMTSFGFIQKNFDVIVDGIANAIIEADSTLAPSTMSIHNSTLLETSANRSPSSFLENPEAAWEPFDTPKNITVMRIDDMQGSPRGLLSWFSVHGTSMNNTNSLVSGDNKGFASYYMERLLEPQSLPGQSKFVAAMCQCNEGDVSPNTQGAMCPDGSPCDFYHSTCPNDKGKQRSQGCIAPGPGQDMMESCAIIGMNQAQKTLDLFQRPAQDYSRVPIRARPDGVVELSQNITGPVDFRHQFINMENITVSPQFSSTGKEETTCIGALGDSFAAGTTDGPGMFNFYQGTNSSLTNIIWNTLGNLLSEPTRDQKNCQHPKPILLNTGGIDIFGAPWSASVVPVQIFQIGKLFILAVPGEFTTQSGRRLIDQVRDVLVSTGKADSTSMFVVGGLSNEYTHYIATPEEYIAQRYEAASTLYGPQTLPAYLQQFSVLAESLGKNTTLPPGAVPPLSNFTGRFFPEWPVDHTPEGVSFGQVLSSPAGGVIAVNETAVVRFQGANPRNNYMTDSTFVKVLRLDGAESYPFDEAFAGETVLTDGDWNVVYQWERGDDTSYESLVTISWWVAPGTPPGQYAVQYFGTAKNQDGTYHDFSGTSPTLTLSSSSLPSSLAASSSLPATAPAGEEGAGVFHSLSASFTPAVASTLADGPPPKDAASAMTQYLHAWWKSLRIAI